MSRECLFLGTMSGPCWDHVWSNFTSSLATALKFSGLSQNGPNPMCIVSVSENNVRTILGPHLT